MKKFFIAAALLLAVTGIGFAQNAPAAKPAKTESTSKHAKKTHSSKKTTTPEKASAEKKN